MMSPAWMPGSVIVIVIDDDAVGVVPSAAFQATANAAMYDWPEGTIVDKSAVLVTGKTLTVVPDGSAPAGTVTVALVEPVV